MTSLALMISILSNNKYTFGVGGTYSSTDLAELEAVTLGVVKRLNTVGFAGDDLVLLKSYVILDVLSTTSGAGQVIEKTVKDTRWKVQASTSSSPWMDKAYRMVADAKVDTLSTTQFTQVLRCDANMERLQLDNTGSPQYGDPSRGEW
jgi:hypothetical protein